MPKRVAPKKLSIHETADIPTKDTNKHLRNLSGSSANDVDLLKRLMQDRTPVSNVLGVLETSALFITNELFNNSSWQRIYYAEDLDCVIAFEVSDGILRLYDIVAREIPPLEVIASRIHVDFNRIEIHFVPDLLDVPALPVKRYVENEYLMVRGPFELEHQLFTIPPLDITQAAPSIWCYR
jgi:hypothetical protein